LPKLFKYHFKLLINVHTKTILMQELLHARNKAKNKKKERKKLCSQVADSTQLPLTALNIQIPREWAPHRPLTN
jgi:hypothetical protein